MSFWTNKKNICAIILSILIISGALFFKERMAEAQLGFTPFGGRITEVEYCCNGLKIQVDGVRGGTFFLNYYDIANPTVVYDYHQVFFGAGQPTVGLAAAVGFCINIEEECEGGSYVSGGTIIKIGTGLPGGN